MRTVFRSAIALVVMSLCAAGAAAVDLLVGDQQPCWKPERPPAVEAVARYIAALGDTTREWAPTCCVCRDETSPHTVRFLARKPDGSLSLWDFTVTRSDTVWVATDPRADSHWFMRREPSDWVKSAILSNLTAPCVNLGGTTYYRSKTVP